MSAVQDASEMEPIPVLVCLWNNVNILDVAGVVQILYEAQHDIHDEDTQAFDITFAADEEHTLLNQGASMRANISYKEAHKRLGEFELVVVPGGDALELIKKKAEPLELIRAYADLQEEDPSKERTIFAVDTGSLLLANQTLLPGLSAAIHPNMVTKLEIECQVASQHAADARTEVLDDRYVVANARFDILPDDPYVSKKNRRASHARKGSMMRRESNAATGLKRRADMRLGGLRVVTTCGSAAGLDASLYLVAALVSQESAQEVSRLIGYRWQKGVVVDSVDV